MFLFSLFLFPFRSSATKSPPTFDEYDFKGDRLNGERSDNWFRSLGRFVKRQGKRDDVPVSELFAQKEKEKEVSNKSQHLGNLEGTPLANLNWMWHRQNHSRCCHCFPVFLLHTYLLF